MAIDPIERPSRFRFTYAFELVAIDGSGRGANRVFNLPINPQSIHVATRAGATASYTNGGVVLEESGFTPRDVTISGTPGLEPKRGWILEGKDPHNPSTGLTFRDGKDLTNALEEWFAFYWKIKRTPEVATKWLMVFHDFRLGRHWLIMPEAYDVNRNAREHRLHYPYEIRFTAVADYDTLHLTGIMGFLADVRGVGDVVSNAILDIAGYAADAEALVTELDSAVVGSLQRAIGAVREVVDGVAGVARGIRNTANIGQRLAVEVRRLVGGVKADLLSLIGLNDEGPGGGGQGTAEWEPGNRQASQAAALIAASNRCECALDTLVADRRLWQPTLADAHARRRVNSQGEAALTEAEVAPGAPVEVLLGARAAPGSRFRRAIEETRRIRRAYTGVRQYVVADGDDLRRIAIREVGDAEAWFDIAELNGLRPPYISTTGMPGTVRPGDKILLPTLGGAGVVTGGVEEERGRIDELALGVDLELGDGGDLVVDAAGTGFRLVRGHDCFVQGLERVRFRTRVGENAVYPEVGILAPVGEKSGAGMVEAIALSVRRACFTDPRTLSVVNLNVADLGDGAFVEVEVQPRALVGPVLVHKGV